MFFRNLEWFPITTGISQCRDIDLTIIIRMADDVNTIPSWADQSFASQEITFQMDNCRTLDIFKNIDQRHD